MELSILTTLGYSSCNEDAQSELTALAIKPADTVLCITGSGARVLDLLTQAPTKIIAVDCNRAQQYLLKLKAVAIKLFDYEQFCQFIGLTACTDRRAAYAQCRPLLHSGEQKYWDENIRLIERGVLFQGQWELHFKRNARCTQWLRASKQKKLFALNDLSSQASFWEQQWSNRFWRILLKLSTHRVTLRWILRDPGFYAHVPASFNIYQYIKECFDNASKNFLLHRSHFAQLLFWGTWHPDYLPMHLQQQHYSTLKNNIDSIEYCSMDLLKGLSSLPACSVDKFSLSDFSSYTPTDDYNKIWQLMTLVAKDDAIVCERQFLVKRDVAQTSHIKRNRDLEEQLKSSDQSIFYTFVIANMVKDKVQYG